MLLLAPDLAHSRLETLRREAALARLRPRLRTRLACRLQTLALHLEPGRRAPAAGRWAS